MAHIIIDTHKGMCSQAFIRQFEALCLRRGRLIAQLIQVRGGVGIDTRKREHWQRERAFSLATFLTHRASRLQPRSRQ